MPFCDQCGVQNPDWARFCDQCGAALTSQPASAASGASAPVAPASPAARCPNCGEPVIAGEAFCNNCGTPLLAPDLNDTSGGIPPQPHYPAPQPLTPPPQPVIPPPGSLRSLAAVHLSIPTRNVRLSLPAAESIVIGRSDAVSGFYPDVDLTPYGGTEQGVGRRHLRIFVQQGDIYIEDQNSTNGTYLHGARLAAHTPQRISNGDEVRLGMFALRCEW